MKFFYYCAILCFWVMPVFAQKNIYPVATIADSLKLNANAVVRVEQMDIDLRSQRDMRIKRKRIVTVFNEDGQSAIGAEEWYDRKRSVNSMEATIYDAFGAELKKIRRKDFKDQSSFDGFSIVSDTRIITLEYTPTQYPFTIVYESEISTSNTSNIPGWYFLARYLVGVESSKLNINYAPDLGFKSKECNFNGYRILKTEGPGKLSYEAMGLVARKFEYASPPVSEIFPNVAMAVEYFNLEGIDGHATTWSEFGKWYSDKILAGTTDLPEETKTKIKALVGTEKDPLEKARIVYKYVQEKSRYVSIQLGLGGYKPMEAKDVDRLAYGDCKALSNYTKALLEVVGVPSYNTILFAGDQKRDIQSDVISVQGNHMMLAVPDNGNYVWLECTSNDIPFGYQAHFSDDRNVLVIKPEGGEIVRTTNFSDENNSQFNKGHFKLDLNGNLSGEIAVVSQGANYEMRYRLKDASPTKKDAYYKERWSNINNLKIVQSGFDNDRVKAVFSENLVMDAANYAKILDDKLIFVANAFNVNDENVKRIRNRKTPFQIARGFWNQDEIIIELPEKYSVESLPDNFELSTKYGTYKTELSKKDEQHLLYKRSFLLKNGLYSKADYEDYRLFIDKIGRNDNAKIVLTKQI